MEVLYDDNELSRKWFDDVENYDNDYNDYNKDDLRFEEFEKLIDDNNETQYGFIIETPDFNRDQGVSFEFHDTLGTIETEEFGMLDGELVEGYYNLIIRAFTAEGAKVWRKSSYFDEPTEDIFNNPLYCVSISI